MAKHKNKKGVKFNITFWQMFTIIIVAVVLGGVIFKFSYDNMLLEEINSISFSRHKEVKPDANNTEVKTSPKK